LLVVEVVDIPALVAICPAVLVAENTQEQQVLLQGKVTTAVLAHQAHLIAAVAAVAQESLVLKALVPEQGMVVMV
jgi:hypothetical protein